MQTCPHCHNALVSPICCSCRPVAFSLPPGGHFSPLLAATHHYHHHHRVPTAASNSLANGWSGTTEEIETSMPTPHVSGHMFHFPSIGGDLAQRLSACQLTCRINCLTHGGSVVYPSSADSSALLRDPAAEDGLRIEAARRALEMSGWYWARMTWQEAEALLQPTRVGTFLLRDSADPRHAFSLSVQTEKGPTSVRIHFADGKFRLKCEASVKASLPEFSCVVRLIEFYVSSNEKHNKHVWVDAAGEVYSPIRISRPLLKAVPSLKHMSRRAANLSFPRHVTAERLPSSLMKYIDEYPYWC